MKLFHDVEIYAGTVLAATASRLELGANNEMLRGIMSQVTLCDGCRQPLVIILAEEDETTVRDTFDRLSHFKSELSIFQSKSPINHCLSANSILSLRSSKSELSVGETESEAREGQDKVRHGHGGSQRHLTSHRGH